ncbi:MAG: hypothetical protein WA108_09750, partial [Thiobacillus sp.]
MIDISGASGRLKALAALLSATWAAKLDSIHSGLSAGTRMANLDRLDTTVASRAPENTALSNATWTAALAASLAKLEDTPNTQLLRPTTYIAVTTAHLDYHFIREFVTGSTTWADAINITGSGIVEHISHILIASTTARTAYIQVEVDGVVVWDSSHAKDTSNNLSFLTIIGSAGFSYDSSNVRSWYLLADGRLH